MDQARMGSSEPKGPELIYGSRAFLDGLGRNCRLDPYYHQETAASHQSDAFFYTPRQSINAICFSITWRLLLLMGSSARGAERQRDGEVERAPRSVLRRKDADAATLTD